MWSTVNPHEANGGLGAGEPDLKISKKVIASLLQEGNVDEARALEHILCHRSIWTGEMARPSEPELAVCVRFAPAQLLVLPRQPQQHSKARYGLSALMLAGRARARTGQRTVVGRRFAQGQSTAETTQSETGRSSVRSGKPGFGDDAHGRQGRCGRSGRHTKQTSDHSGHGGRMISHSVPPDKSQRGLDENYMSQGPRETDRVQGCSVGSAQHH